MPPPHCLPHAPQSFTSEASATHARPHIVSPEAHVDAQIPRSQTSPALQTWLQTPQFITFEVRSTQAPPQDVVVSVQTEIVQGVVAQLPPFRAGLSEMSASPGPPLAASGPIDAGVTEPHPSAVTTKPTRIRVSKLMHKNLVISSSSGNWPMSRKWTGYCPVTLDGVRSHRPTAADRLIPTIDHRSTELGQRGARRRWSSQIPTADGRDCTPLRIHWEAGRWQETKYSSNPERSTHRPNMSMLRSRVHENEPSPSPLGGEVPPPTCSRRHRIVDHTRGPWRSGRAGQRVCQRQVRTRRRR